MEDSSEEVSPPTPDEGAACEDGAACCDSRRSPLPWPCFIDIAVFCLYLFFASFHQ
jgi:hypothetical protein